MQITIIAIITIICILIYYFKNTILNAPIELYKKKDKYLDKFDKLIGENNNESNTDDIKDKMNLQNLDNDFPILFTTLEKKTMEQEQQELLKKKRELDKILRIKDSVYELERDLLEKNKKLIDFAESTSDRVLDAALDAEEQKRMAEKAVIWIKESAEKQKALEIAAEKLKKEISEKHVRMAEAELKRQKDNVKLLNDRTKKMESLSLDVSEQEVAKQSAIDASKKAAAEAVIAESHKKAAEKSAEAAKSYKIKAKKEAEAILAKALLDKIKNNLLNNKSQINELINNERETKLKMQNEAEYEKKLLTNMSDELKVANKKVYEIEKEIKDKQGENMILTYKEKIAAANKISGGKNKEIKCDMIKTITEFNGNLLDDGFEFNGKDNLITIPSNLSPQLAGSDFTIEFWCKVNSFTSDFTSIYRQGTDKNHDHLAVLINSKYIYLNFSSGRADFDISNINFKNWNHYAIVYDRTGESNNGSVDCYVNGSKLNVSYWNEYEVEKPGMKGQTTASGSVIIGKGGLENNIYFNGEMKKLKIYNIKLNDIEIKKSSKFGGNEYCPQNVLTYIPMNKKDNFIYTRNMNLQRKRNDIIINEIFIKLEYAVKNQRKAQDKWNNRKKILIEKLKKFKEEYNKNKAKLNLSKEKFEFELNEQLKAEKELLKKQSELDNADRQNKILKDELIKAEEKAEKRIQIQKLKDRLKQLDKTSRIMEEKQIKILEQQAARLKILEATEKEKLAKMNLIRTKKQDELNNINLNIKDKGLVTNVNIYPIPSSDNKPYNELYDKYPILHNNNILVLQTIDTAINVLNNFDTVEIEGHIGKVEWIKKNNDSDTNLDYCLEKEIKEYNFIKESANKYVCPATAKRKDKVFGCNEIELGVGIIIIKNLMPKLEKPLLNKTLRKLDSGIVNSIVKYTSLEIDNKGDTRQIQRLNLDCGDLLLGQFRLLRGLENKRDNEFTKLEKIDKNFDKTANQIGYEYTCKKTNKIGDFINKKTQINDDGKGANYFLDRHNINCQTGIISSFNLKSDDEKLFGENFGMYYDYKCMLTGTKNCTNHHTIFESEGDNLNNDSGHVKYLNKHNVICPENKFLKSFNLERNEVNEIRYNYKCCELTKEGEVSTGDIPDNYKKENIVWNGTSNEHSYIFNGINNYFVIPEIHSPIFSTKPFTIEFGFKFIKNKFTFIFSQGYLPKDPNICCTFFGIAIRSSTTSINKSINNKIYLTFGYKAWESVMEFKPNINYHFAVTYDSNKTIRMYVNGLPISFIFKNDWRNMLSNNKPLLEYTWLKGNKAKGPIYIGKYKTDIKENYYFNGEINNLRIWNIDRNENQIKDSINKFIFNENLILFLPLNKIFNMILINDQFYSGPSELSKNIKGGTNNEELLYSFIEREYKDIKPLLINENINIYPNFKITFYLKLYEKTDNLLTNILHISTTNNDCCNKGDRICAIWIEPSSTKLMISTDSLDINTNNFNSIVKTNQSLSIETNYFITFIRNGDNVKLEVLDVKNNKKIINIEKKHNKIHNEILYGNIKISNNFYKSPKGIIKNINFYKILTKDKIIDGRKKQFNNQINSLNNLYNSLKKKNNSVITNKTKKLLELKILQFKLLNIIINRENSNENELLNITYSNLYIDKKDPLRIECKDFNNKTLIILGSIYFGKNDDIKGLIKFKPKNENGYCSSTNKCKGINENTMCLGLDQPLGDEGCNSYCSEVKSKYYRSDLEGCVNNYCLEPNKNSCDDMWFSNFCNTECTNKSELKIGTLKFTPVFNDKNSIGATNIEIISSSKGKINAILKPNGDIILPGNIGNLEKVTFNNIYKTNLDINKELCSDYIKMNNIQINNKLRTLQQEIFNITNDISKLQQSGGNNKYIKKNNHYIDMSKDQSSNCRLRYD